jgi:hypothetical protein
MNHRERVHPKPGFVEWHVPAQTAVMGKGVGTGRNSTYAIFLGVTRYMERLHIFGHICDGIQERDLLFAVGYFVENDSHALMNCRGTGGHTRARRDFSALNAVRSL